MTETTNAWRFKRGLDDDFMKKLKSLRGEASWFAEILGDQDLILGIRDNYMNVYWQGQSLFKIERKSGQLKASTHPKYLLNPDLSKAVPFNGETFEVGRHDELLKSYDSKTLGRMKRAANLYTSREKEGVHKIFKANSNVIDTEVAFNSEAEAEDEPRTPRIDLACFEEVQGHIRLRFWEAKRFANVELFAKGDADAPVVGQISGYRKLVEKHRDEIHESYRRVAANLVEISRWADGRRTVGKLVEEVGREAPRDFTIDDPPIVGLLIYEYDRAQIKDPRWETHITNKLKMPILHAGDPKNIKLLVKQPVGDLSRV